MRKIYIFKEDRKGFGENLKRLMGLHGLTIESLANELNYDVNTIKKWRSGSRVPSLEVLSQLSKLFDISIQELYLPNSLYSAPISEPLQQIINGRLTINDCGGDVADELVRYCDYLFQKMLFSFLTLSDKKTIESLFSYFEITPYGIDKLELKENNFESFSAKTKEYVNKQYGISFPYKADKNNSISLLREFDKWINYVGGRALCR